MRLFLIIVINFIIVTLVSAKEDPLPSWSDSDLKQQIIEYVESVSNPESSKYVPWKNRIAALDLDGTLMAEWPVNFQRALAVARLKDRAEQSPQLKDIQPFKAALEGDHNFYNQKKHHSWVFLTAWEQATEEEYKEYIDYFLSSEMAPHWNTHFENLFYKPAVELVTLLRKHDFQVYICSTTEVECIRVLVKKVLDFNPVFVIGNEVQNEVVEDQTGQMSFVMSNEFRAPENRSDYKSVYFTYRTGRRPIFAFGNSSGDTSMLKLAQSSGFEHFVMILDHDDPERELEYHDQKLLQNAKDRGWHVISMKKDFKQVFTTPVQPQSKALDISNLTN